MYVYQAVVRALMSLLCFQSSWYQSCWGYNCTSGCCMASSFYEGKTVITLMSVAFAVLAVKLVHQGMKELL